MRRVRIGVDEIDTRSVGVHAEQSELEVSSYGKRIVCVRIGNSHSPVVQWNVGGRVDWVHGPQIIEFRDVVDTVAVHVSRVSDEVLLHPVALGGLRLHVFTQRGRAGFTALDQYRNIHGRVCVHLMTHVKHEVVGGCGLDDNGHGRHCHRRRNGGLCWTRLQLRLTRRLYRHRGRQ